MLNNQLSVSNYFTFTPVVSVYVYLSTTNKIDPLTPQILSIPEVKVPSNIVS